MAVQFGTTIYKKMLEMALDTVYVDRVGGLTRAFEELFFPLKIDEGQFAFQKYSQQMLQARKDRRQVPPSAAKVRSENSQIQQDLAQRLSRQMQSQEVAPIHGRSREARKLESTNSRLMVDIKGLIDSQLTEMKQQNTAVSGESMDAETRQEEKSQSAVIGTEERAPAVTQQERNAPSADGSQPAEELVPLRRKDLLEKLSRRISSAATPGGAASVQGGESALPDIKQQSAALSGKNVGQDVRQEDKSQATTIVTSEPEAEEQEDDFATLLLTETDASISPGALIIQSPFHKSRVVAVASAGHGKTTLLKRLALYCCRDARTGAELDIQKYGLPYDYDRIPCLVYLRNLAEGDYSIDKAIVDSVYSMCSADFMTQGYKSALYQTFRDPQTGELAQTVLRQAIEDWVKENSGEFLLLLDGLDELADNMRLSFLVALEDYLEQEPDTHVIITSRVAGLSERGVKEKLSDLQFRGRSIMPLTDTETEEYAKRWLKATQPEDQVPQLLNAVSQILTERRFMYLKEFMRTPLDLLVILKQVASNTLSQNRYQMFRDMMWVLFTNHVKKNNRKRAFFEDTMAILGFIAYHMQLKDSLYITMTELRNLTEDLQRISFQTDLLRDKSVESVVALLNSLAANVGIIEKDDRTQEIGFTFPIRAHQEFLSAYACCHLKLDATRSRTSPTDIIRAHLGDSRWLSIINFALSDLHHNNNREFETLIDAVFRGTTDLEQLQAFVESDLPVNRDQARILCESAFRNSRLSDAQRRLLITCMGMQAGPIYNYALRTQFQKEQSDDCFYLEAYALTAVMWGLESGHSPCETAVRSLAGGTKAGAKLGAMILSLLAKACMDDEPMRQLELGKKAKADLKITEEMLGLLRAGALNHRDVLFVTALTDLRICQQKEYLIVKKYLTDEMYEIAFQAIRNAQSTIRRLCAAGKNATKDASFRQVVELLYTLGTLPLRPDLVGCGKDDLYTGIFLRAMYTLSKGDKKMDQVAFAVCGVYYVWEFKEFMEVWTRDICRGVPGRSTQMNDRSLRQQYNFALLCRNMAPLESQYMRTTIKAENALQAQQSVIELFRESDVMPAVNRCIAELADPQLSNRTLLAFFLRYGEVEPEEVDDDLDVDLSTLLLPEDKDRFDIPGLLAPGLEREEPMACANMMLYEMASGQYDQARQWLRKITPEGWQQITQELWFTELWKRRHDPEGALICMLAARHGGCAFDDHEAMFKSAFQYYPDLLRLF